jgi:hypothetical protein
MFKDDAANFGGSPGRGAETIPESKALFNRMLAVILGTGRTAGLPGAVAAGPQRRHGLPQHQPAWEA